MADLTPEELTAIETRASSPLADRPLLGSETNTLRLVAALWVEREATKKLRAVLSDLVDACDSLLPGQRTDISQMTGAQYRDRLDAAKLTLQDCWGFDTSKERP